MDAPRYSFRHAARPFERSRLHRCKGVLIAIAIQKAVATGSPFGVGIGRIHYFKGGGTFVAFGSGGGAAVVGGGEVVAPEEADFRRTRMAGGIKSQSGNSFAKGDTF